MRVWCVLAIAAVGLSGCGGRVSEAQAVVARDLKDPGSAEFRNVKAVDGAVCGEVNGKNAFGAYAGFQRFIVFDDQQVQIEPRDPVVTLPPDPTLEERRANRMTTMFADLWSVYCAT